MFWTLTFGFFHHPPAQQYSRLWQGRRSNLLHLTTRRWKLRIPLQTCSMHALTIYHINERPSSRLLASVVLLIDYSVLLFGGVTRTVPWRNWIRCLWMSCRIYLTYVASDTEGVFSYRNYYTTLIWITTRYTICVLTHSLYHVFQHTLAISCVLTYSLTIPYVF